MLFRSQYMSLAITPKSATSTLRIDVVFCGSNNTNGIQSLTMALFQDSTANALASEYYTSAGQNYGFVLHMTYLMTSGTTSATTFKVRVGANTASTTTFNGNNGSRYYGGTMASSITIMEII